MIGLLMLACLPWLQGAASDRPARGDPFLTIQGGERVDAEKLKP
jgi:hypothetical protein